MRIKETRDTADLLIKMSKGGGGTTDYSDLNNKPSINSVTLSGNKTSNDLGLQNKLTAGSNITIEGDVISATGGGGTTYTAGDNIQISDQNVISATDTTYTAGANIAINDGVISATDTTYTAGSNITITNGEISATDTTYSTFTGTDGSSAGSTGLVPAPATTDAGKFLKADGTWDTAGGGGGSSYTAGSNIDITSDVISVTGILETTTEVALTKTDDEYYSYVSVGSSVSPTSSNGSSYFKYENTTYDTATLSFKFKGNNITGSGATVFVLDEYGEVTEILKPAYQNYSFSYESVDATIEPNGCVIFNFYNSNVVPEAYLLSTSGALTSYVKKDTASVQTITGPLNIANDVEITGQNDLVVGNDITAGNALTGKSVAMSNCTVSIANNSAAFGSSAEAKGYYSFAVGDSTKAARKYQFVEGKYNIEESGTQGTEGTYVHIVGNGTRNNARSNAYTLDWSGNGWFSGDVYVGSTSGTDKDAGSKKLATEYYVDQAIGNAMSASY